MSELPKLPLEVLCEKITDGTHHSPQNGPVGAFKYITAKNIKPWGLDLENVTYVDADTHAEIYSRCDVQKGDVLYVKDGAGTGAVALNTLDEPFSLLSSVAVLRPGPSLLSKFLLYALQEPDTKRSMLDNVAGVAITRLTLKKLKSSGIPITTLPQQARIVAKLDEVLSDLDVGVAELKAAQKKLQQYRQSLLKVAIEGALTASWREARHLRHTPVETGARLLQRVLAQRRAHWEAKQRAKFEEQGKVPPKDWQKKYVEPVRPDTSALPALPEGWEWSSLDMLGEIVSGVAKGTKRNSNIPVREVPYLRVANVQRGHLDLSEVKTILTTEREIDELTLINGDVLLNEGGDRDKLGRGWVWRNEIGECIHQNHVFRMRPYLPELQPELISHHGNTFGKSWFQSAGKQTTNLASISMTMLRSFPVPLAPADEQEEILAQIRMHLDSLDKQVEATDLAMKQAIAQRQNVLRAAFTGQLVPEDVSNEPVGVFVERICAERAERLTRPTTRKTKRQKEIAVVARKLIDVLAEAGDWLPAQEAFRICGVVDGTLTAEIETLYAELRALDKAGRLNVQPVVDEHGRKLFDKLKLTAA
ncbi:restriction endonuclease subunit S [Achromobacter spanius]|uniref:restriction endonuclease subunit S n=1 Tax=Achromobacter spanius TaxID=217203 RepID=UPI003826E8C2